MAYYCSPNQLPDNLYRAPNGALNDANILSQNMASLQSTAPTGLPFNNYNSGFQMNYNYGYQPPIFNNNPFLNTNYNYSQDAGGNISSSFSQKPDYLGIGLYSTGIAANAFSSVMINNIHSKTIQQKQQFENMAYQQHASQMAQMQKQQMQQSNTQNAMNSLANFMMMQKFMESMDS